MKGKFLNDINTLPIVLLVLWTQDHGLVSLLTVGAGEDHVFIDD